MKRQACVQRRDSFERLSNVLFTRRTEVLKSTPKLKPARRIGTQIWLLQNGWEPATDIPAQAKRKTATINTMIQAHKGSESYQGKITFR